MVRLVKTKLTTKKINALKLSTLPLK